MKKRVLSIIVACVMMIGLVGGASAATRGAIFPVEEVSGSSLIKDPNDGEPGVKITTHPGEGTYLRIWYENTLTAPVTVTLCDEDGNEVDLVPYEGENPMSINSGENEFVVFRVSNSQAETFRIYIESSGRIRGNLAVAQYVSLPS